MVALRNGETGARDMTPYLQGLLSGLQEAVFILDNQRRVIATNAAAEKIFGRGFLNNDFVHIIRNPECLGAISRVAATGEAVERVFTVDMPIAATFQMVATKLDVGEISSIEDEGNVLVSLKDVSDKREAQQMRTDFVANVSHELRSPLTAITGFIETLQTSAADDPDAQKHFLNLMEVETQRMVRLIADLLSLSKVQAQQRVRPGERVGLTDLLGRVVETLSSKAMAEKKAVKLELAEGLPFIVGSEDELTQVFQNLIENAINYGKPHSTVTVTSELLSSAPGLLGDVVSISIADESEGIPQKHISRLTERFYRVDTHRSRNKGGTGLGLAIVKHIINRHRGRLLIASEPDIGSTFTVLLPTEGAPT